MTPVTSHTIHVKIAAIVLALALCACTSTARQATNAARPQMSQPWSERMASSFVKLHPDTISYATEPKSGRWTYEQGVMLESLIQMARATHDDRSWDYIKRNIDLYVQPDGAIRTYEYETSSLDNIATGRALLALYQKTHDARYRIAADTLRKQLANQPRTPSGGFWHKKIYPNQMWLDGLYMAEPFYAEYAAVFHEPADFDDVVHQFSLIEEHTRDPKTGLLYHAWDELKQQPWANPKTGTSPNFWSRAMGWYMWALVDVLDYLPADHPGRNEIIGILQRLSAALLPYRAQPSGLWYQVVDQGGREGNYLEASGSCMFIYAFAKGAHRGYLDKSYLDVARASFKGVVDSLVTVADDGTVELHHTCQGAGLGGKPYRDGSYEYYIHEPQRTNDFKAVGPFILAALELKQGSGK